MSIPGKALVEKNQSSNQQDQIISQGVDTNTLYPHALMHGFHSKYYMANSTQYTHAHTGHWGRANSTKEYLSSLFGVTYKI